MTTGGQRSVPARAVGVFLLVCFGSALLLDGLMAATGGLGTPQAKGMLALRMFTPALASWAVCRFVSHESWLRTSGLTLRSSGSGGRRGWPRILGYATIGTGAVAAALVLLLALVVGAGWFSPDWALTSFTNHLRGIAPDGPLPPVAVLWILTVVANVFAAYTVNGLVALGEETGWRGWLQSALEPLGIRKGIVLTGAIWGLWHAPLIAMGYEYGHRIPAAAGIVLFACLCIGFGTLLSWLRLRSGSVVPAAIAHGAFNAFATLPAMLVASGDSWDPVLVGLIGWPAVALFGMLAVCVLRTESWDGHQGQVRTDEETHRESPRDSTASPYRETHEAGDLAHGNGRRR
jgi:CAAX amino terminal protease family protein